MIHFRITLLPPPQKSVRVVTTNRQRVENPKDMFRS